MIAHNLAGLPNYITLANKIHILITKDKFKHTL